MHAYFVQYGEYAILMSLLNNESLMKIIKKTALDARRAFFSLIYHTLAAFHKLKVTCAQACQ